MEKTNQFRTIKVILILLTNFLLSIIFILAGAWVSERIRHYFLIPLLIAFFIQVFIASKLLRRFYLSLAVSIFLSIVVALLGWAIILFAFLNNKIGC